MTERVMSQRWEVRPSMFKGQLTSYDICHPSEPGANGVAVVASVYGGEEVARTIAALPELLAALDGLLDGPTSLNAALKRLRTIKAKIGGDL